MLFVKPLVLKSIDINDWALLESRRETGRHELHYLHSLRLHPRDPDAPSKYRTCREKKNSEKSYVGFKYEVDSDLYNISCLGIFQSGRGDIKQRRGAVSLPILGVHILMNIGFALSILFGAGLSRTAIVSVVVCFGLYPSSDRSSFFRPLGL